MNRSVSLLMASACCVLLQSGCASHLHSPANLSLSQKAQEQFESLSAANRAVFDKMFTNLATFSQINSGLYEDAARRVAHIEARQVTKMNWKQLRDSFGPKNPLIALSSRVTNAINEVNGELKKVRGESKEALKILIKTGDELTAAKATVTSWNRRVAVLDKIIESTPSIKEALEQIKSPEDFKSKVEAYTGTLERQLGEQKVVYLDADGTGQTNSLADEIKSMLGANADSLDPDGSGKILAGLRAAFSPKAPGLVITAAALAKDLAEAESTRLSTMLNSLENRLRGLAEARKLVDAGMGLSKKGIANVPVAHFSDGETVQITLTNLANVASPPGDTIADALVALSHYVTIQAEYVSMVEEALLNDAHQQHLESIKVSQINLRQHEAMAAHGIESLLIYHSGGIKPEELADVAFKVVQLGLLTWIGGGIN